MSLAPPSFSYSNKRPPSRVATTTTEESLSSVSTPFVEVMDVEEKVEAAKKDEEEDDMEVNFKKEEEDDMEVNFKTPRPGSSREASRISYNLVTPGGIDIEKLRPRPLNLSADDEGSPAVNREAEEEAAKWCREFHGT